MFLLVELLGYTKDSQLEQTMVAMMVLKLVVRRDGEKAVSKDE